jgi:hypothetical protein
MSPPARLMPLTETGAGRIAVGEADYFPAVHVPPSEIVCHPSRISNTYEPCAERVIQPGCFVPEQRLATLIELRTSAAPVTPGGSRIRAAAKRLLARSSAKGPIDLGERLIYDARFVFNGNMTHLVQHHLATLGYLRHCKGIEQGNLTVILESGPRKMALEVMQRAGYEVIATDQPVSGNVVRLDAGVEEFFHLLPYVRYLGLARKSADMPKKIFISRRGTRRLINESEVKGLLSSHGFETVYFEDLAIAEQWALMRNATDVVAIHGAALGCLAFQPADAAEPPLSVVELFGSGFVTNVFRKYAAILGGRWVGCRGRITPEVARDVDLDGLAKKHAFADFELSPQAVQVALDHLALAARPSQARQGRIRE